MINVVCIKWGKKYSAKYANNLFSMVSRHLTVPFKFVCLTDNPNGINEEISTAPIPDTSLTGWWTKLSLFAPNVGIEGPILYMDLDVVIVDNIDCFASAKEELLTAVKWRERSILNSSIMRFEAGKHVDIYDDFVHQKKEILSFRKGFTRLPGVIKNDQEWVTEKRPDAVLWPDEWYSSYKHHCYDKRTDTCSIPDGTKIIVFHGTPNPPDAHPTIRQHWK